MKYGMGKCIALILLLVSFFVWDCRGDSKAWRNSKIDSLAKALRHQEEILSINAYEARTRMEVMDSIIREKEKGMSWKQVDGDLFWQEYKAIREVYRQYLIFHDSLEDGFMLQLGILRSLSQRSKNGSMNDAAFKTSWDSTVHSFSTFTAFTKTRAQSVLEAEPAFTRLQKQLNEKRSVPK